MIKDLKWTVSIASQLAKRDIKAQYRQSILGILWAFILPIINTITWVFLNQTGVVKLSGGEIPYPIYVFTGTMLWQILSDSIIIPIQVSVGAKPLFSKVDFPHASIMLSAFFQILFNSSIKILLLIIGILFLGVDLNVGVILFPVFFISLILFGITVSSFLAPIGILYNDISKGIPLIMQLLMYLTPVVFFIPETGLGRQIFLLNPLTTLISTSRNSLTGQDLDSLGYYFIVLGVISVVFAFAIRFYKKAIPLLIERMSS